MIFQEILSNDRSELLRALLWGEDRALSYNLRILFRELGLTHLLAASGANLAFVESLFLSRVPGKWSWAKRWFAPGILGLYTLIVNQVSLWRAFAMWLVVWLSGRKGRKVPFAWTILVVVLLFLLWPKAFGSVSFQLSVAAVSAIGFSQAYIPRENIDDTSTARHFLRLVKIQCITSFFVMLFIAPFAWWHFGSIQIFSGVSTLVMSPLFALLFVAATVLEFANVFQQVLGAPLWWGGLILRLFDPLFLLLELGLSLLFQAYSRVWLRWLLIIVVLLPGLQVCLSRGRK